MDEPIHREVAILNAALELPAEARPAFLDDACAGDAQFRQELEALLRAHERARDFLESPPTGLGPNPVSSIPFTEKPGDLIGHYRLLQQIGEGGCGVVYMAEQEEPVRRRVALKVIKLGMDTRQVIARFEAERLALALMDHPNIAKILDAGVTGAPVPRSEPLSSGRPYFVMELVRGAKITDFCDENKLPTPDRLKLFIQVCQAIQHAHQKGVIHRDIKPSNILVTINDGVPVPKVIDFGIAKATAGRLTDQTVFTAFEQFIGTPAYMSPEQAVMTSQDIDTRSDIYSLGVLLYELLTGKTPFDTKELLSLGIDELCRTIREKEPVRPSTRLAQRDGGLESQIASRKSPVDCDLDWIVMKCLEKDRARRYETANGLARDIERHLNCEPVAARPPSKLYEFQKTLRRHKFGFAAMAAIILALAAGVVVSTWQALRATRAEREQIRLRQQAEEARARAEAKEAEVMTEAERSRQVSQFLQEMLRGVRPSVALGRDTIMLREILDRIAKRIDTDLTNEPAVAAELRHTLAGTYHDLAQYKEMELVAIENLNLSRARLGDDHLAVVDSLAQLADALMHQGKLDSAEKLVRETLGILNRRPDVKSFELAVSLNNLANVLREKGNLADAEGMFLKSLDMEKDAFGDEDLNVAATLSNLGVVYWDQGRLTDAENAHRQALGIRKKRLGDEHPDLADSLNNLSLVLREQGRLDEAERICRDALSMQRKLSGNEHPSVANALNSVGIVLAMQGKWSEAESSSRAALAIQQRCFGEQHPIVARSLLTLAIMLKDQNKLTEAEPLFERALTMNQELLGWEHPDIARLLVNFASLRRMQGRLSESEDMQRKALILGEKVWGPEHPAVADSLHNLGTVLSDRNKLREAEDCHRRALAIRRNQLGNRHPKVADSFEGLADVFQAQGRLEEAQAMAQESLIIREEQFPKDWRTHNTRATAVP